MPYANNKGADQPAHQRSLTSAFVFRCLDRIIPLISLSEISSLYIAPEAKQAGLSLPWSQAPKTGFLVTRLIFVHVTRKIANSDGTEFRTISGPISLIYRIY